jgi:catechol 2,3-dioxygenase-like lactoylglutathione lyase family enzyme
MAAAVAFYAALGLTISYGGADSDFTSMRVGEEQFLNLITAGPERRWAWWGRLILHVDDVDAVHARALAAGLRPEAPPRDAEWGERYFHVTDPDGHEVSIARPLR